MKTISIVTPCYNEAGNIPELIRCVRDVMVQLSSYQFEHIFIDNASTDETLAVLRQYAAEDLRIKIIVNARNFGHIRSPYHALLQAQGDAVISIVADLQDPPGLMLDFVREWEAGHKVVVGIKTRSREAWWMYRARGFYYKLIKRLADVELLEQFTGFGLYDRQIMEVLRGLREPYPYFRGLISDVGYNIKRIEYTQPERFHGRTKNNFFSLFDIALLGLTSYSKVPLRLATLVGFFTAGLSLLAGFGYLIAKLLFWNTFTAGVAPVMLGIFFLGSVQLIFMGIVGEYVGAVFTYVQNRPLVIEKERINF
ncbi:MAG: glycosyltransferase family 2 protein [Cephaloticoccus sp.]|nr:glycosyltransferase family 2 protein [Cephaloticoccus sp.]MCF7759716.1 glycosyltransferase family 2 protein [Cephaloticoccus sp.]